MGKMGKRRSKDETNIEEALEAIAQASLFPTNLGADERAAAANAVADELDLLLQRTGRLDGRYDGRLTNVDETLLLRQEAAWVTSQRLEEIQRERQHVVRGTSFEERLFKELTGGHGIEGTNSTLHQLEREYKPAWKLANDVFRTLYQLRPVPNPEAAEEVQNHLLAIGELLEMTEYQQLHELTSLDDFAAAVGTAKMTTALVKQLQEWQKQQQQQQQQGGGQCDKDGGESEGEGGKGQGQGQGKGRVPDQETLKQLLRQAAREAAQQAAQQIKDGNAAYREIVGQEPTNSYRPPNTSFGLEQGKQQLMGNWKLRSMLAQSVANNPKLARILRIAGRMKQEAFALAKEPDPQEAQEIADLRHGQDLAWLANSEMVLLTTPGLRRRFLARMVEQQLLQYELIDDTKKGKGPIIVAIDESGSMGAALQGATRNSDGSTNTREDWAKGVFLALLAVARAQKRDLRLIHFSSGTHPRIDDFPRGRSSSPEFLLEAVLNFYNGGTDFTSWMKPAREALEGKIRGGAGVLPTSYTRADVIFITDAEGTIPHDEAERWRKFLDAHHTRCFGIVTHDSRRSIDEYVTDPGGMFGICHSVSYLNLEREHQIAQSLFDLW